MTTNLLTIEKYLGFNAACEYCGTQHCISVKHLAVSRDWPIELCSVAARYVETGRIALVDDLRTRGVAGSPAAGALSEAGFDVVEHTVPDPAPGHNPVCDDHTKNRLDQAIPAHTSLIVAVGSGVINDLAKWLAYDRNLPYFVVATAPSMNGYASDNIAATISGVKTLIRGKGPAAIFTSEELLATAPRKMIAAGLGDILAKWVSSVDCKLNHFLFHADICPRCSELLQAAENQIPTQPEALSRREPGAVRALFEALIITGFAMTVAGSSAPASGGEHLISHTLDMMSALDGQPHDLHGRQVGIGTIVAAKLYEHLMLVDSLELRLPADGVDRQFWGKYADHVQEYYTQKKASYLSALHRLQIPGAWDELKTVIAPHLRKSGEIRACLEKAHAACRVSDLGITRNRFLGALQHAHEMRARFTVLDLGLITGQWPRLAAPLSQL